MRILRGKSNYEVSSQGFALFVVGLVLATFLGGAIRTILSSDQVHSRIVTELKGRFPRNEFQIGRTEVLLSHGFWPGFGLKVNDLVFKQDLCGKLSFVLHVPTATIPMDLLSLLSGRVRAGRIEIQEGEMALNYHDCPTSQPGVSQKSSTQGIRSIVTERGIQPMQLDWKTLANSVEGFSLRDFSVTYERNLTWKMVLKAAEVKLSDDLEFFAKMEAQKSLPFGTLAHSVEMSGHGHDRILQWFLHSDFKEGHIEWRGSWDLAQNSAATHFRLIQIPLKELSHELYQMGFTPSELKLKTAWVTCAASWSGVLNQVASVPVNLQACKLEGSYGRVDLDQADFFVTEPTPFKTPAVLRIQKLQIQPLIESLGRQVLPAVIARLGFWSGNLNYRGKTNWELDGFLENLEVIFSNQSLHGKQVVQRMHTDVSRTENGVSGKVDEVALQDGEFDGTVDFQLSDDWRNGNFSVSVGRFSLSPSIQNLLVGGAISPAKIKGQGSLQDGDLSHWSGTFNIQNIQGEGWRGQNLELKTHFIPDGVFRIEASGGAFVAAPNWRYFPEAETVMGKKMEADLSWRALRARLEVQKSGGLISDFSAVETGSNATWHVKGSWVRDGELYGSIKLNNHARFAFHGEKGNLTVSGASELTQ